MPNWRNERELRLLRELTFYYMLRQDEKIRDTKSLLAELCPHLPEDRQTDVRDFCQYGLKKPGEYDQLLRFLYFVVDRPKAPDSTVHTALFKLVVGWFFNNRNRTVATETNFLEKINSKAYPWFDELNSTPPTIKEIEEPYLTMASQPAFIKGAFGDLFRVLKSVYKLDLEVATKQAAERLCGTERCTGEAPQDDDRQGYDSYRYSVNVGRVVKTFTIFTPPTLDMPFCTFKNIYKDRNGRKDSTGIAIKLEHGLYCIGAITTPENGAISNLKIIAFPNQILDGDVLHGFIMTRDDQARVFVARTAFVKTSAKHHRDARPGVVPFEQVPNRVPKIVLPIIRNFINFKVGRLVRNGPGKAVSAEDMVDEVDRLCSGAFTLLGRPFNPAKHGFYPFNQALLPYSNSEEFIPWCSETPPDKRG